MVIGVVGRPGEPAVQLVAMDAKLEQECVMIQHPRMAVKTVLAPARNKSNVKFALVA
jgi:hypothetical protein